MKAVIALAMLALLGTAPTKSADALEITGPARIIDGDTISIGSQVIRLLNIDAPENGQSCLKASGRAYNCGAAAENHLRSLIDGEVSCSGTEMDNYRRLLANCRSGQTDINREMVLSGHAVIFRRYSDQFDTEERAARAAKRGLWSGDFEMPWDFRRNQWADAVKDAPDPECPIKGNVNGQGERIYHAPWSRSYARTKIDTSSGERWFCSEADALAAGWRAPYR